MNYYANDKQRIWLIAGLRDLADSAVRSFGLVQYRAVAIPHRARKKGGE